MQKAGAIFGALLAMFMACAGAIMAEEIDPKFAMIRVEPADTEFAFAGSDLDFASVAPAGFIWNDSDAVPTDFVDFAVFSAFRERYIGYEPLNRDRFEIRVYTARIFPERVALASDYARLLASVWGAMDFGVMAHDPQFGEVLGGDDASGIMIVNRIAVFRRGDELLILRLKFHADHFDAYAPDIARFVGSIAFAKAENPDPIASTVQAVALDAGPGQPAFGYGVPANWQALDIAQPSPEKGRYALWIDAGDPNRNSGLMQAVIAPPVPMPKDASPDPQAMANTAAALAEAAIQTLLPGQTFTLDPSEKTEFGELEKVSAFNSLFVFNSEIGPEKKPARVAVLISMGRNGAILGSVMMGPQPSDPYLMGTMMHGNYVVKLAMNAQQAYWAAQQN